jgi:ATP-dependent DNA helicase RecG
MIKISDGTTFDKARSVLQDLTFHFAERFFSERGVGFEESSKRTLGMIDRDGFFTNAALLLSDQCSHGIKCAVFEGTGKTSFKARKEFSGSILKQIDEAYEFIDLSNNVRTTFEGLRRIDIPDYPAYALRESLLNAVVHRDYDYSGSSLVNIFSDRIEFVSIGGLVKGITLADIMRGVSQSRNMVVAAIFYRLELIESYGTGIQRIMESYLSCRSKPRFEAAPASFVVTLPNMGLSSAPELDASLSDTERVLKLLDAKGSMTRKDIEVLLKCSSFPAGAILSRLVNQGILLRVGAARTTRYIRRPSI